MLPPPPPLPGSGSPPATAPQTGTTPLAGPAGGAPTDTAPGTESARRAALARSVRVTRTHFSTHGPPAHRGTVISFRLGRPGKVLLVVRSGAGSCDVLGRRQVAGVKGLNRVRFMGRVQGRPLAPGQYMIDVLVVRGKSHKRVGRVAIEIVRPGRRLTRAQRAAPVGVACAGPAGSTSLLAAIVDSGTVDHGSGGAGQGASGDASKADGGSRGGVLGAVFKAPTIPGLYEGDEGGLVSFAWLGLGVYLVLVAAAVWRGSMKRRI